MMVVHGVHGAATLQWTSQCSGIVYTGIYLHVINIYLHKRFNTIVNLVYTVIYSCILPYTWYILSFTLVYDILSGKPNLYLVYMLKYQVYDWSFSMPCHMEGPFPMPCHMADSRQNEPYVHCHISVTYI
jgi:hypothetical protein